MDPAAGDALSFSLWYEFRKSTYARRPVEVRRASSFLGPPGAFGRSPSPLLYGSRGFRDPAPHAIPLFWNQGRVTSTPPPPVMGADSVMEKIYAEGTNPLR